MSDEKKPGFYGSEEILEMLMASHEKEERRLAEMPKKFPRKDGIVDVLDDDYLGAEWCAYKDL